MFGHVLGNGQPHVSCEKRNVHGHQGPTHTHMHKCRIGICVCLWNA